MDQFGSSISPFYKNNPDSAYNQLPSRIADELGTLTCAKLLYLNSKSVNSYKVDTTCERKDRIRNNIRVEKLDL